MALGIDDPEAWLDAVSPRVLAIWQAFFQVEPWGREYERHAIECSMISQVKSMIAATAGVTTKPESMKVFMPDSWQAPPSPDDGRQSIKTFEQYAAKQWGGK